MAEPGLGDDDTAAVIAQLEQEMVEASQALEFERAALLRDQIQELRGMAGISAGTGSPSGRSAKASAGGGGKKKNVSYRAASRGRTTKGKT